MNKTNTRRKLLKTFAIGGSVLGVPGATMDKWLTPVIDAVVLPAHAQTSRSTRYSMLNPNYPLHSQAQSGVSAQLASMRTIQDSPSIASMLSELLISSATAASVPSAPPPSSSTARLEMYLERIGAGSYQFIFSMSAVEGGLTLVLYGEDTLQVGDNTIHLALCEGDPKPYPIVLEKVSDHSASVLVAGEVFVLNADSGAIAPVKEACSTV